MILYPAIDLRGGRVVRLREGDPNQQTVFSDDPLSIARQWQDGGAQWLHMVNLDGAFGQASVNLNVLANVSQLGLPIQFGGGLRSLDDIAQALDLGASRVVLGTVAVQNPQLVADAVARFGAEAICIALDARDGKVTTHGWQTVSDTTPSALGQALASVGVRHALYTDVKRDGGLQGVDVAGTSALAHDTGLNVIASGGVSQLSDLSALAQVSNIAGVIVGMALYTGQFSLAQALATLQG